MAHACLVILADVRGDGERRWIEPNLPLETYHRRNMKQPAYLLSTEKCRSLVRTGIGDVCNFRQWHLRALHVRTNHVHGVVDAADPSYVVIRDWKCYTSRLLKKDGQEPATRIFWMHSGSARKILTESELARAVDYVLNGQGETMEIYCADKRAEVI